MGHHTLKDAYRQLTDRLNLFPQGVPPSETLFEILKVLLKEEEAKVLSRLPVRPFTAEKASRALKMSLPDTTRILDELASRAILLDVVQPDGSMLYLLPPPMAGFFEFSLMRLRPDMDQKLLSELYYQYMNVEEDFVRDLFAAGETKLGRIYVNEPAVSGRDDLTILDHDRVSRMIQGATRIGVGTCYCRHKMSHAGTACDAPMEICMTLNNTADSLIRHGHAREVSVSECMTLLDQAYDHHLVQIGENEQTGGPFICNCCGCCCEALLAIQRFGTLQSVNTTPFLPEVDSPACTGCGRCVDICPVKAIKQVPSGGQPRSNGQIPMTVQIDEDVCLGCGVCLSACRRSALKMKNRGRRTITPVNSVHRIVLMAIERGKLQNLVFDNQAHLSHRAMAAVLGAILKMPPVKQLMASQQMKSRYLARLIQSAIRS